MNSTRAAAGIVTPVMTALLLGLTAAHAQVQQAWFARYNGPSNRWDSAVAVVAAPQGGACLAGASEGALRNLDFLTVRYHATGVPLWTARYNGTGNSNDVPAGVAVDSNGCVYLTGTSRGPASGDDIATIKYDPDGNQLWATRFTTPGNKGDSAAGLALDAIGNVYVAGTVSSNNTEYLTIKYDTAGNEVWKVLFAGTNISTAEIAAAMAVDPVGNVYVTGSSMGAYYSSAYATIKYLPDGTFGWAAFYAGPGGLNSPADIKVDAPGNVYVTGRSEESRNSGRFDYATVKYSPEGSQLWVARYNSPLGTHSEAATGLGLDAAGNVYVTGTAGGAAADDLVTACYGSDGTQRWTTRYNGAANSFEAAAGIALDQLGNVYVHGTSRALGSLTDLTTLKYAPDGTQLWVTRSGGAASTNVFSRPIAAGWDGAVWVSGEVPGVTMFTDMALFKLTQVSDPGYPHITVQPESVVVVQGSNAAFSVQAAGAPSLVYSWHFNSQTSALAGTQNFLRENVQPSQQGEYTVRVTNSLGAVVSRAAILTVNHLTNQPQSQSVVQGAAAYFKVEATGVGPFAYQWRFNGADLPGATSNLFVITNAQAVDAGSYQAVVSNFAGVLVSATARLSVSALLRQEWADGRDPGHSLASDPHGNLYVAGSGNWLDATSDYITCKFTPDGNRLWRSVYNGPGNGFDGFSTWWFFKASLIAVDGAGNAYVSGTSKGTAGVSDNDFATIKYDAEGNLVWLARLNATTVDDTAFASCLALDHATNVYVTGFGNPNYRTAKYDRDGNFLWVTSYAGADLAYDMALDAEANVYITGYQLTASSRDYETVKYDTHGNQVWASIYSATGWTEGDAAFGLALDSQTNVIVAGVSYLSGTDQDYATIKMDRNGSNLWARRYPDGGLSSEGAYDVAVDPLDNVYVTGNVGTAKYSPTGNRLWFSNAPGRRLIVDGAGAAYALNSSGGGVTGTDYLVTKLDSEGNLLWAARYGTLAGDSASAFLLVGETNLYVTGSAGTVKFVQQPPPPPTRLHVFAGPASVPPQLALSGEPGRFYNIEISTNLLNWAVLTNVVNPAGMVFLDESTRANGPATFYRARKEF